MLQHVTETPSFLSTETNTLVVLILIDYNLYGTCDSTNPFDAAAPMIGVVPTVVGWWFRKTVNTGT